MPCTACSTACSLARSCWPPSGSTAPFVGLLGTVWGIYNALTAIGLEGKFQIEQVSGPVGEALVMTAAGLAVAIPAVLAYNVLGRLVARIEADLEGFARDLRELLVHEGGVSSDPRSGGALGAAGQPPGRPKAGPAPWGAATRVSGGAWGHEQAIRRRAAPRRISPLGGQRPASAVERGGMSFGRLEKPRGNQPMSDINVTPLVDVMLVLLVIFIITAPLMTSQLALELPKTAEPVAEKAQEPESFVCHRHRRPGAGVLGGGTGGCCRSCASGCRRRPSMDPATELQLRADTNVPYGQVVQLIGMAQSVGLSRIGFVADPVTGEPLPGETRKP